MLKNWNRRIITAMIIILSMLIVGCGMIGVNENKDRKLVVAEVDGEKILKGAVLDEFDLYAALYGGVQEDKQAEIKAQILDQLVNRTVIIQKAKKAGFELNDEYKAKAEQDKDSFLQDDADKKKAEDVEENDKATKSDEEYLKEAKDEFIKWLEAIGLTEEQYVQRIAEDLVMQAYFDKLTEDLTVEDEELKQVYDAELEFQTNYPSYREYSSVEVITEPAMRRVKHILIMLDKETTDEIEGLRVDEKEDEADELREEKLKEIKARADEVLAKVKAGEDFEDLLNEYGEDPGMKDERYAEGYTMLRDASMRTEFLEASFELAQGEISELVATDNGYHIIKVLEANEDEVIEFEELEEEIREVVLDNKRSEKSNSYIDEWVENANIKKFESRL